MAKRFIPPTKGDGVRIRLLAEADLPLTLAWRNQDHIRAWFNFSERLTEQMHRDWWRAYREKDDDFVFVIEELVDLRAPVGQVAVYGIDWAKGEGEYGRCMVGRPEASGRNLLYRASELLFKTAGDLGLRRLHLEVKRENAKARHVYEKLGFVVFDSGAEHLRMERYLT